MSTFWQEKITIGTLSVPRFMGGPLDGITDAPFRKLVREFSHASTRAITRHPPPSGTRAGKATGVAIKSMQLATTDNRLET